MSPTLVLASQGDSVELIRVIGMVDTCRPMVLKVRVGISSVISQISPFGYQSQLNQSLEAVTDSQHQTVPVIE